MFNEHPHLAPFAPKKDDLVWRYLTVEKFLVFITTNSLLFSRSDILRDQWEGAYGQFTRDTRPERYGVHAAGVNKAIEDSRPLSRERIHVNCWTKSDYESAAMWDLYVGSGPGVAIQTTWGRLTASIIDSSRHIYGGSVTYADYSKEIIPEANIFYSFMTKRKHFEHENEVRLLMMTGEIIPNPRIPNSPIYGPSEPKQIPVEVSVKDLVNQIYFAPGISEATSQAIASITSSFGHNFKFSKSDLDEDPIY